MHKLGSYCNPVDRQTFLSYVWALACERVCHLGAAVWSVVMAPLNLSLDLCQQLEGEHLRQALPSWGEEAVVTPRWSRL